MDFRATKSEQNATEIRTEENTDNRSAANENYRLPIQLLVAVGLNGDAVVLNLYQTNPDLIEDLSTLDVRTALWPSKFPSEVGIYLFAGYSCRETVDNRDPTSFGEVIHQCTYKRLANSFHEVLRQGYEMSQARRR